MDHDPYLDFKEYDRRKKLTGWVKSLTCFTFIGWFLLLFASFFYLHAIPHHSEFLRDRLGIMFNEYWEMKPAKYFLYLSIGAFFISLHGFVISAAYFKRESDHIPKSIIGLFIVSLIAMIRGFLLFRGIY